MLLWASTVAAEVIVLALLRLLSGYYVENDSLEDNIFLQIGLIVNGYFVTGYIFTSFVIVVMINIKRATWFVAANIALLIIPAALIAGVVYMVAPNAGTFFLSSMLWGGTVVTFFSVVRALFLYPARRG